MNPKVILTAKMHHKGHQCKRLFWLEPEFDQGPADVSDDPLPESIEPEISLLAVTGICTAQTMQMKVRIGTFEGIALFDTGSTHNFLNKACVAAVNLPIQPHSGLRVKVANGDRLDCMGLCTNTQMTIAPSTFAVDFYIIPLSGFDVILGMQWLSTLGSVLWNFAQMQFSYWAHNTRITWTGLQHPSGSATLLQTVEGTDPLDILLAEFEHRFSEPTGLPPTRSCDHRIRLVANAPDISVRPYRYAHIQKDKIEC